MFTQLRVAGVGTAMKGSMSQEPHEARRDALYRMPDEAPCYSGAARTGIPVVPPQCGDKT